MGVSSAFYIAQTGLTMSQIGMEVASHNVANVNTEGYSRQRLNLEARLPIPYFVGPMGTGVEGTNIQRMHDQFIERNLVDKSSILAKYEAQKISMDSIEGVFNESYGNGINESLSNFWNAWQDVANNPEGYPERVNLLEKAETLTLTLNIMRQDLDQIRSDINRRVEEAITQANTLVKEIAALNQDILAMEGGVKFQEANDLRDKRQQHILELSQIIDINYIEDPADGSVTVMTPKGVLLVEDNSYWQLEGRVDDYSGDIRVMWQKGSGYEIDISESIESGQMGGWLELRDEIMADFYLQLENFTRKLITEVNDQHVQGVGLSPFDNLTGTYGVSDFAAYDAEFTGQNNDLHITSRVQGTDGEKIGVRFIKAATTQERLSVVTLYDAVNDQYNITVTLPIDQSGEVIATAEDVARIINEQSSPSLPYPTDLATLPGPPYMAGDLINATVFWGQDGEGLVDEWRNTADPTDDYFRLNHHLEHVLPLGNEITWGYEYAQFQTRLDGDDNDLIFRVLDSWLAADPTRTGEEISIEYIDPAVANSSLSVAVTNNRITVSLATDASGAISTTANDIITFINTSNTPGAVTARGMIEVERALEDDGSGLIVPLQSDKYPIPLLPRTPLLPMQPQYLDRSGTFDLIVYDPEGAARITPIRVRPTDTLQDVIDQINAVEVIGVKAVPTGIQTEMGLTYLRLTAEPGYSFALGNDNCRSLTALGLNTFFDGENAATIKLNEVIQQDPGKIAAGRVDEDGFFQVGDDENALDLADLKDEKFSFPNQTSTISEAYNTLYSSVGATGHAITRDHDFNAVLVDNLHTQVDMISAVNLDEEMADLMKYQYMYQASARMISAVDEMMQTLLSIR